MVSGQVDDKEGDNVLKVRILVEGVVLEYEPSCVAKTPGEISTTYRHAGGAPRCQYKGKSCAGNSVRETFDGV